MQHLISLPNSKSLIIRNLVAHFVRYEEVLPVQDDESNDVLVTYNALVRVREARCNREVSSPVVIDVRDCGAAYRFLMALLSVTPGQWLLTGTDRLLNRPMDELVAVLRTVGANIERLDNGWRIVGRNLKAETLTVNCSRTSQYASALLLIAPKLQLRRLSLHPAEIGSQSYINLTRSCMDHPVEVPELTVERLPLGGVGDWSSALFFYAYACLHPTESFLLENLTLQSAQGDSVIARWFECLGVVSEQRETGVWLSATPTNGRVQATFDVADHPDVVPVMAALACLLPADFRFVHTRNLAYKESNRTEALHEQLSPFADIDYQEDEFRISGKERGRWPVPPYQFRTMNDHRLAMAFLLFGADAELDSVGCLQKSWGKRFESVLKLQ